MTKISNRKAGVFSSIVDKSLIEVWLLGYWDLVIVWKLRFGHWDFRLVRVRGKTNSVGL
jgi:hypothetical protein